MFVRQEIACPRGRRQRIIDDGISGSIARPKMSKLDIEISKIQFHKLAIENSVRLSPCGDICNRLFAAKKVSRAVFLLGS